MKLAYVVSTQPTRFQAVAFSPDFEANVARLAALGYDGVELAVRDPALLDWTQVKRIIAEHHLAVPALGTGQAFVEERLSFTDPDPDVRKRAVERVEAHVKLAREFGALVILGLIRGKVQTNVSGDQAHNWLLDALQVVSRRARDHRVRLAIEPINRYETDVVNTVAEALALIDEIGADNLGVLFDTFHANIEEPQIEPSLRACGPRLFHVHFADSNRWPPGMGHTDFGSIVATLREMNYAEWISAEILPKPDMAQAQERTINTVKRILEARL